MTPSLSAAASLRGGLGAALAFYRQAPLKLAAWGIGHMLLLQALAQLVIARRPVLDAAELQGGPALLQLVGLQMVLVPLLLVVLTSALAGLVLAAARWQGGHRTGLADLLRPLVLQPLPLLLLPLLSGAVAGAASLLLVLPGLLLAVGWSLALPVLLDRGCEAWTAMATSLRLVLAHPLRLLPPLALLALLTLATLPLSPWLPGLWLPLLGFWLQDLYRSVSLSLEP